MCPRIETKPARATTGMICLIDVLQILSLVLEDAGIAKSGAVSESADIPRQDAGSTALQTAYEYISNILTVLLLHNYWCFPFVLLNACKVAIRSSATRRCRGIR